MHSLPTCTPLSQSLLGKGCWHECVREQFMLNILSSRPKSWRFITVRAKWSHLLITNPFSLLDTLTWQLPNMLKQQKSLPPAVLFLLLPKSSNFFRIIKFSKLPYIFFPLFSSYWVPRANASKSSGLSTQEAQHAELTFTAGERQSHFSNSDNPTFQVTILLNLLPFIKVALTTL